MKHIIMWKLPIEKLVVSEPRSTERCAILIKVRFY